MSSNYLIFKIKWFVLAVLILFAGIKDIKAAIPKSKPKLAQIESGFKNIPDSVQTSVYWYWISDNISKAGVIKDLNAMKRVGINRGFYWQYWVK